MLEQKDFKYGSTAYVIQQLPATRGMEVGIHLIHVLMGGAEGFGGIHEGQDFLDAEYNPAVIAAGLMSRIHQRDTPTFIKTIVRESLIVPDPGDKFDEWYELHFAANYDELLSLLTAIIEHNGYIDLVKKRLSEVMGLLSSDPGKGKESTPSSKAQS